MDVGEKVFDAMVRDLVVNPVVVSLVDHWGKSSDWQESDEWEDSDC